MNSRVSALETILNGNTRNNNVSIFRDNDAVLRATEPVGFEFFRYTNINPLMQRLQVENPTARGEDLFELVSSVYHEIGTSEFLGHINERDIPKTVDTLNEFARNKANIVYTAKRDLHARHNASAVASQTLQSVTPYGQATPWNGGQQFSRERAIQYTPRRNR